MPITASTRASTGAALRSRDAGALRQRACDLDVIDEMIAVSLHHAQRGALALRVVALGEQELRVDRVSADPVRK